MTTPSLPVRDGGALCLACGLCCSGELFEDVRLDPAELDTARKLRLPLVQGHGEPAFEVPCPQHVGGACAAYEERPRVCREFVCHTLAGYLAGDLDLGAAEERIVRLRRVAARVRAALPEETRSLGLWVAVRRFAEQGERAGDQRAWRSTHGAVLLEIFELERRRRDDFTAGAGVRGR
jgi:hypothetical protein